MKEPVEIIKNIKMYISNNYDKSEIVYNKLLLSTKKIEKIKNILNTIIMHHKVCNSEK
jgi:hypothetical protein